MARGWTTVDSLRLLRSINQGIDILTAAAGRNLNLDGQQYDAMLHCAIDQYIEILRSDGRTLSDPAVLFSRILNEINILLVRWELIVRGSSSTEIIHYSDGGLSEETVSEYLKIRSCNDRKGNIGDDDICTVCRDQLFLENGTVAAVGCGHEYHVECIKKWLQRNNTCPLCRAKVIPIQNIC